MNEPTPGRPADNATEQRKRALRAEFRTIRRAVANPAERSVLIWNVLATTPHYRSARSVLLFDSVPGEPTTDPWKIAASRDGKDVWVPEALDLPAAVDLVVVPGVAFTASGDRLGQGGGWYDRYLAAAPAATVAIGVCFAVQVVADLPTEGHDRRMQLVICEDGIVTPADATRVADARVTE